MRGGGTYARLGADDNAYPRSWIQLDARSVGTGEVLVDRSVTGTGLPDLVSSSGEVRVRVRCTNGSSSFYAGADQLRIVVTRA